MAWDDVSSVPAATVLDSRLQATDRMGAFRSAKEAMSCQRPSDSELAVLDVQPYEFATR